MKITSKTTREELVKFIGANVKEVKVLSQDLFDRIAYADNQMKKDPKKVTKADLASLAKEVIKLLGDTVHEVSAPKFTVVAENNTKPPKKLTKTKKEETPKEEPKAEPKAEEQKPKTTPKTTMFPEELQIEGATFVLAHDIKDIKDLLDAFNNSEDFRFAFYWTKAQIKQYNYANGTLPAPKEFANNLDITSTVYVSDNCKVCYNLSIYTEALYQVMPDAFEEVDGIRYSDGIEFQIYRQSK